MDGWREGWTDESEPEGARVMPHVQRQDGYTQRSYRDRAQQDHPYQQGQPSHGEPPLPPELSPRRGEPGGGARVPRQADGGGYGDGSVYRSGGGAGRPRNWRKRITYGVLTLVLVLIAASIGTYFWADGKLARTVNLSALPDRPPTGKGTNYLIVGSDSREGMTPAQEQKLHTGAAEGMRTDSMMILHIGANGDTLLSLPRDSYVTIPAFTGASGKSYPATTHKLNTAYSWGGGALLAQTVEHDTGIHIDHYAEIGFTGFVNLVNALGGVTMCLDKPMVDQASGADFKAGCQKFNGDQSLEFVRERHQEADEDLGRMRNQQKFLGALAHQAATPGTVLDPFTFYPLVDSALGTLIVDDDCGLTDLGSLFLAMKDVNGGDGKSLTVPIGNPDYRTKTGESAVLWDATKSKQVFDAFKNDTAVPDIK
jgi:LCP family protein required for cell wall assembly